MTVAAIRRALVARVRDRVAGGPSATGDDSLGDGAKAAVRAFRTIEGLAPTGAMGARGPPP